MELFSEPTSLYMYINYSTLLKVPEVNVSGPTTLSFGSYYGPKQSHGKSIIFLKKNWYHMTALLYK